MTLTKYWVRETYWTETNVGGNRIAFNLASEVDKVVEENAKIKADLARVTAELEKAKEDLKGIRRRWQS